MTPEVNKRNQWILPIFSLRIGREQHVADSSNHSLCLIELFSFSNSWGTLRRVTWFGFSPSFSSSSTNMVYVFVYVSLYVYVYAYVYVYVTFHNGLFSASSYIQYLCNHESSRTPQHSEWNCVGTDRPQHMHMYGHMVCD